MNRALLQVLTKAKVQTKRRHNLPPSLLLLPNVITQCVEIMAAACCFIVAASADHAPGSLGGAVQLRGTLFKQAAGGLSSQQGQRCPRCMFKHGAI